jgi:mannose-1-phosphate guanylyltransferase
VGIGSILFSAGEGKRLRPLTNSVAKPAVPLLDVPLGAFGLASLIATASPVVVNASHRADSLEASLRSACPAGWRLFDEGAEGYGTAGTIAALADEVEDPLVVYNGDLLTDLDPTDVMTAHESSDAGITIAVREVGRAADVILDGDRVTDFVDRRRDTSARGGQYIGVAVIDPSIARAIPTHRPLGLGESVFSQVARDERMRVYRHDGYVLDVGTVDRFLKATNDCLYGIAPPPPVPFPGRTIEIDDGMAYLGPGVVASKRSLGAGAVILQDAYVDAGAHILRSVVWPGELVPEGEVVRDAVWIGGRALSL